MVLQRPIELARITGEVNSDKPVDRSTFATHKATA